MFFLLPRAAVVLLLLFGLLLVKRLHRQWRARIESDAAPVPRLPTDLVTGADRTWVVFTTPYCAQCGPVADRLRACDPRAEVVTVDATRRPDLADAFRVRASPTVLLADRAGDVQARLVGAAAVDDYVRMPA